MYNIENFCCFIIIVGNGFLLSLSLRLSETKASNEYYNMIK